MTLTMPVTEDTIKAKGDELRQMLESHQACVGTAAAKPLGLALRPVARTIEDLHQGVPRTPFVRPLFAPGERAARNRQKPLTPRMRTIARLIAEGHTSKEMADILKLSVKTIETHRMAMMARMGVHDVASVVRYALRTGLIDDATATG